MEEKLMLFLTKECCLSEERLCHLIEQSHLELLLADAVREFDKQSYFDLEAVKREQSKKNKVFLKEIEKFLCECEKEGLKPVFTKGIFLAAMLYEDIDVRIARDIDIFIDKEEFLNYHQIFSKLGYTPKEDSEGEVSCNYASLLESDHIVFEKESEGIFVCFEVHGYIMNPPALFHDITPDFLENSEKVTLLGLSPYILSLEYNIVYLIMHYFKHLPKFFHYMLLDREVYGKLLNVHDIAVLVSQNRDVTDWDKIISIAKKMRVVKYIRFVAGWVNEIYGAIFPDDFMRQLEHNIEYSQIQTIFQRGMGHFMWLFEIIADKYEFSVSDMLKGVLKSSINFIEISNSYQNVKKLNSGHNFIDEKTYHVVLPDAEKSAGNSDEVSSTLKAAVNKNGISVEFSVRNKFCCPYEGEGALEDKDGIEMLLVKGSRVMHKIFTIAKTEGEDSLEAVMSSRNGGKNEIRNITGSFPYHITMQENGFVFQLELPWSIFGIDKEQEDTVLYNISGLVSNPLTGQNAAKCNLFSSDKNLWDFRGIGAVQF